VCKVDNYRDQIFEANANLEVLDCKTKEGEEMFDTSDDDYGEEGENELFDHEILQKLDPETREKYLNGELSMEEMKNLGLIDDFDFGEEGEFEMEEEGEDEDYGEEDGAEENSAKKQRKE